VAARMRSGGAVQRLVVNPVMPHKCGAFHRLFIDFGLG
jgi:hypothetical protein